MLKNTISTQDMDFKFSTLLLEWINNLKTQ